jgi:hypothetical protein
MELLTIGELMRNMECRDGIEAGASPEEYQQNVGIGYVELCRGDIIKRGDEYYADGRWNKSVSFGRPVAAFRYRRKDKKKD